MDTFESAKAFFLEGLQSLQHKDYSAAEGKFRASLDLLPGRQSTMTNLSLTLIHLHRYEEAEGLIRDILAQDADSAEAHLNLGLIERDARLNYAVAMQQFDRALSIRPDYAEAHINRGVTLAVLRDHNAALAAYDCAIALNATSVEAHHNRAITLWEMKSFDAALAAYDAAYRLAPDFDYLLGKRLHAKMQLCQWDDYDEQLNAISDKIRKGQKAAAPFHILSLVDDPSLQRRGIEIWVDDLVRIQAPRPTLPKKSASEKIRIGYFSADFRNHPVASLIAEILELHDRAGFEIIAFSYGPQNESEMRKRLVSACDTFHDVSKLSDEAIASLSRENRIDIGIDLTGYTEFARPELFALGCAPIQVNYLGFPGTWGSPAVDYIVADGTLIDDSDRQYYAEKVVYLPHSHMPHDRKRRIADRIYTREEVGLPPSGTVFCCFNNIYKVTPDVFKSWMRILKAVEGSVLWLFAENEIAIANLRGAAERDGIGPSRLIFAGRVAPADHLARYRVADIFLDTLPYNAHLTACDALWAGIPVLTRSDKVFVSRIAASVLCAAGLPELVAEDRDHYERLAIDLARDPMRLATIKQKLAENRLSAPLFDSSSYTKYIEDAYTQMYLRYRDGQPPADIHVRQAQNVNMS